MPYVYQYNGMHVPVCYRNSVPVHLLLAAARNSQRRRVSALWCQYAKKVSEQNEMLI